MRLCYCGSGYQCFEILLCPHFQGSCSSSLATWSWRWRLYNPVRFGSTCPATNYHIWEDTAVRNKSQHNIQLFALYNVWTPFLLHLLPTSHATWEPVSDGSIHVFKWHPVTKGPFNTSFWCWNSFLAITGAYECSTFYSSDIIWIGYGQPAECGRNCNVFGNNIYSDMWCCKFK